jgi:hypothetical protein
MRWRFNYVSRLIFDLQGIGLFTEPAKHAPQVIGLRIIRAEVYQP